MKYTRIDRNDKTGMLQTDGKGQTEMAESDGNNDVLNDVTHDVVNSVTNDVTNGILHGSTLKAFLRYLLPSFGAMLISCVYSIADTIFIGRYSGETGLGALSIVLPLYSLLYALGAFFAVGGSVLYSIEKGKGETGGKKYFTVSLAALLAVTAVFTVVLNVWFRPIMEFMGAKSASGDPVDIEAAARRMELIEQYGRYVTWGALVCSLNAFMTIFVRNDSAPNLAMFAVVASGLLNILLDYLLVFKADMGMGGAALATIISMGVSLVICLTHFTRGRCGLGLDFRGSVKCLSAVTKTGFPTFITDFTFAITIMLFNIRLQKHIGAYAVSVYSVLCNIVMVLAALFAAVAAAIQPLVSVNFGAGKAQRVREFLRLGVIATAILSVFLYAAVAIYPKAFTGIFVRDPSAEVTAMIPRAIRIYGLCLLFMGHNFVLGSYYQSTLKPAVSLIISLLRGLVLCVILMFLLPVLFPSYLYSLWWVVPLSEILTLSATIVYAFIKRRKSAKPGLIV